jgi:hypothetical protein
MATTNENDLDEFKEQIEKYESIDFAAFGESMKLAMEQHQVTFKDFAQSLNASAKVISDKLQVAMKGIDTDTLLKSLQFPLFDEEVLCRIQKGFIEHGRRIEFHKATKKVEFKKIKKRIKPSIIKDGHCIPDFPRFWDFFIDYNQIAKDIQLPIILNLTITNYDFTLYHYWENFQRDGYDEIYSLVKVWEEVDVRNLKKLLLLPEKKVQEVMNRESFERLFFSVSVFQGFVKKLVEEELIEEATFIFKGKGKMFFAGIIKSLHRRSYTKRKLTNNEVLDVCNNVFGAGMKLDSVKKGEANSRDLNKYLPPYTNTTTNGI